MDSRKIDSRGESAARLARNIACVKYTLFCFNIVAWVSGKKSLKFIFFLLKLCLLYWEYKLNQLLILKLNFFTLKQWLTSKRMKISMIND